MSERVATGVIPPVEDVLETAAQSVPLAEGASVIEKPETEQQELFIPEGRQTVISGEGMPKYYGHVRPEDSNGAETAEKKELSTRAGSIFHGEGEAAVRLLGEIHDERSIAISGLSIAVRNERRKRLHGLSPALFRSWAERAARAIPDLYAALLPGEDEAAFVVPEAQIYLGKKYKKAAGILEASLENEQRSGDGTQGPIERALLTAAAFQLQGKRTGKFAKTLREWPESAALTKNAVRRLTQLTRTHLFIKGGNMIAAPTSRPDILEFVYKKEDKTARNAAEALSQVMQKNIGFDPERLYGETVYYTEVDESSGKELQTPLSALDAVHWAAMLIAEGRLTPCVLDIKLQTHAGTKWANELNPLWKKHDNDLTKIFSTKNLETMDPMYEVLRKHWQSMERDVAATVYSFLSFMRMTEREFRNRNPREHQPIIKWDVLAKAVRAAIVLVDFDISKPGEKLQHVEGEEVVDYETFPPMDEAGVPENVSVMLRPVESRRLQRLLVGRERRMRIQYVQQKLAKYATKGTMDQVA